jgi:transposase, IS30 family
MPRHVEREFWRLVKAGHSAAGAAASVGVSQVLGWKWYVEAGGMPTLDLAEPAGRYLSFGEREEIAVLRAQVSIREIARRLGRSPSTVSRELRRNTAARKPYRATSAQSHADARARRPKTRKLVACPALAAYVQAKLDGIERYSPQQVKHRIRLDYPDDEQMRISHETIYRSIYVQGRGGLRGELNTCLRTGRAQRRSHRQPGVRRERIKDMVMISERPAEVKDRAVPGWWEGDLIIGAGGLSAIGTLVERTTRFTMLLHLDKDHGAVTVRDAITTAIMTLPAELRRSLTWDQGIELAQHAQLSIDTNLAVYFCDPHAPWQRGTNENTNGLLRQYFPKATDLSVHSPADLAEVAGGLNRRPRKTLHWKTPAEAFSALLSKTA